MGSLGPHLEKAKLLASQVICMYFQVCVSTLQQKTLWFQCLPFCSLLLLGALLLHFPTGVSGTVGCLKSWGWCFKVP